MIEEWREENTRQLPTERMLRRRSRRLKSRSSSGLLKVGMNIGFTLAVLLVAGAIVNKKYLKAHYAVMLKGKPIVALASREKCDEVILQLKKKYFPQAPRAVAFLEGQLAVERVDNKMPAMSENKALETLAGCLTAQLEGYAIKVNGIPLVMLATKADAAKAIGIIQQTASADGGVPTFQERVLITTYTQKLKNGKAKVPVLTPEKAARELYHTPVQQYFTIRHGDNFYRIALDNKTTVKRLKQLNPDVDPGALHPGDKIRLPDKNSPITVVIR